MSTINRAAYQRLVDEDTAWLDRQPRSLEREHIEQVLRHSVVALYGAPDEKRFLVVRKRDTEPTEAWIFGGEDEARWFFSRAGAQWSETYLCRILGGPRDVVGETAEGVVRGDAGQPDLTASQIAQSSPQVSETRQLDSSADVPAGDSPVTRRV